MDRRRRRSLSFERLESRVLLSATTVGVSPASKDNGAVVGGYDPAALASVRAGEWSNPATWGGVVPTADRTVVVRHDVVISSTAHVRQLTVEAGTLRLDGGQLHAHGSLIVYGTLRSQRGTISFHVANDRLFTGNTKPGPVPGEPDFHPDDTGLWVMPGGTVDLRGETVTPWLNAIPSGPAVALQFGASAAPVFVGGRARLASSPIGWRAGDDLLLVNERGEHRLATLTSISGNQIAYQEQAASGTPSFQGNVLYFGGQPQIHSKVANLSRRLTIESADVKEGDTAHRAHVAILEGGTAELHNVEFRDLGPRGKLGRYPIHWHHGGEITGALTGSSLWQDVTEPGNRFVALHHVSGVRVENNVAFRSRGHGFFLEDGAEFGNTISHNLSVAVEDGEELPHADASVSRKSHHFWLRAGNVMEGNVAAGGTAFGLIVLPSSEPGSSVVVVDQESLGVGDYGMWAMHPDVVFRNPRAAYNRVAGLAVSPAWGTDGSGVSVVEPVFLLNGRAEGAAYNAQLFLNNARDASVHGGILAGTKALHTHYRSSVALDGVRIVAGSLLTPTYWEMTATIAGADISVTQLFDRPYPIRSFVPGLLQLLDSRLRVGSGATSSVAAAYFVGQRYAEVYGLAGVAASLGAVRLLQPPAPTGFVAVTVPEARQWKVWRPGTTPPASMLPIESSITVADWQSKLPTYFGYGAGIPSGKYHVELFDSRGQSLGVFAIDVRSGVTTAEFVRVD